MKGLRRTIAVVRTIDLGITAGLVLWRELLVVALAIVAGRTLIAAQQPGWGLAVMVTDLVGAIALLRLSVGGGHLHRALRWGRLRWASGLRAAELDRPAVARLADVADGILCRVARCPVELRAYLEPAVDETIEVVRRAVSLAQVADQHRQQLELLGARRLDEALAERLALLDRTRDVELRLQLAEGLDAIDAQRRLVREHRRAVERIDGELDAAEQTLAAAAAGIERAVGAFDGAGDRLPLGARQALRQRVDALSSALVEVGG